MKKWIVILAALMLLTAIAVPAFAANTEATVTASKDMLYAGDEVTFTVSVSGDVPYTSFGYTLTYDQQIFSLVRVDEAAHGAMFSKFDTNTYAFMMMYNQATAYAGPVLTVTLKVNADAPAVTATVGGQVSAKNGNDTVAVTFKAAQVVIGCRHSYTWVNTDGDNHTGTCSACGDVKTEKHAWADEGINVKPATCTEPGSETLECLICDATKTVELKAKGHGWDNDCDTDCNNGCGTTRETAHKYATTWTSDAQSHWYACSVCGDKKDVIAHVPGAAATEKDPQVCTVCAYVIQPATGHIHDFDTIWQQDADNHWHVCKKQGCYTWGATAPHDYDDACDVSCNTCSHVRVAPHTYGTEWKGNAEGHWTTCTACGALSEVVAHVPGDAATEDTPQVCTECQFWITFPLSHEHTYGEELEADDDNHWKICTECGTHSDRQPHNWDEGTIVTKPTETQEGSIMYVCKDCNKARTATLPVIETEPTEGTESTEPAGTQPSVTPPANNDEFPWWILIVVAATLLVTGIVLFVIEFIRSKKHNMHGKFSK